MPHIVQLNSGSLPAGTNNIGDVDVLTLPALPAGINNIGDVDVLTLPSLPAGTNNIGVVSAHAVLDSSDITSISEPAVDTAASITFAAPGAGFRWVVKHVSWFYTGAAGAGNATIESPSATFKYRTPSNQAISARGEVLGEVYGGDNAAVIVTLPAGAAGATGKLYASARKVRVAAV